MRPIFGPLADEHGRVLLPVFPANASPPLTALVAEDTSGFLSSGEDAWKRTSSTALAVAKIPASTTADLAVKLMLCAHESYPALLDGQLALAALEALPDDTADEILDDHADGYFHAKLALVTLQPTTIAQALRRLKVAMFDDKHVMSDDSVHFPALLADAHRLRGL